jgi:hypothetical protein
VFTLHLGLSAFSEHNTRMLHTAYTVIMHITPYSVNLYHSYRNKIYENELCHSIYKL